MEMVAATAPSLVEIVAGTVGGTPCVLRVQSTALGANNGHPSARLLLLRDVAANHTAAESVWRNERLAGIGLLAMGIAHEINNPLGSALLAAETALAIQDMPETAPQLTACLNNIVISTDRCGRIVRTLLRYSHDSPTEKQCCSVNDVVEQAIDLTRPYAERQGVVVQAALEADIPLTLMNPLEIELVLVNLLRNASKASRRNTQVLVRTELCDRMVRVSVADQGCGMTNEQIEHMFDPLYTTHQNTGGCGLGLAVAAGIIRRHSGSIEVRSTPGSGTTMVVNLPASTPTATDKIEKRAGDHGADSYRRGRDGAG